MLSIVQIPFIYIFFFNSATSVKSVRFVRIEWHQGKLTYMQERHQYNDDIFHGKMLYGFDLAAWAVFNDRETSRFCF